MSARASRAEARREPLELTLFAIDPVIRGIDGGGGLTTMVSCVRCRWWSAVVGLVLAVASMTQPVLAAADSDATACQRAGLDAEREADLPPGILLAIGLVESGRRDPLTGRMTPWPWTIDANGTGWLFNSLAEALAETRALQARGMKSIDVGCFQINLLQHPTAFASLEQAFDPQANAAYAARFLLELRNRTGSWENAIAAYHSATPERGGPYRDSVMAALKHPDMTLIAAAPHVVQVVVWTPLLATGRVQIWRPSAPGLAPAIISFRAPSDSPHTNLPVITSWRDARDNAHHRQPDVR